MASDLVVTCACGYDASDPEDVCHCRDGAAAHPTRSHHPVNEDGRCIACGHRDDVVWTKLDAIAHRLVDLNDCVQRAEAAEAAASARVVEAAVATREAVLALMRFNADYEHIDPRERSVLTDACIAARTEEDAAVDALRRLRAPVTEEKKR